MRRLAALATLLAAGAVTILLAGAGGGGSGYRVDAIFDNASNLIPGQDVKVAGAKVGSVADVRLTPDRRARVQMDVDPAFGPFRSDATCSIQPQSLIGEKFVQCEPGTPRGRELRGGEEAPTVPLARTHAPVDLDLVFAALRLPYRQRVQLLVNELGGGLAGRGEDLNAAIRRANPAIGEANRVLAILDRDRARLGAIVERADAIVHRLARRRGRVAQVIERAASVTQATAARRGALAETVQRLPALLAEAEPGLERLRDFAVEGAPVFADLERAAPQVNGLLRDVAPFAAAARPAVRRLGRAAVQGRRTVRAARPVVRRLRSFARAALPTGRLLAELVVSLSDRGAVEGLQRFVYFAAAASSRFDRFSHIIPAHALGSECQVYAREPVPACDAHFAPSARAQPGTLPTAKARGRERGRARTDDPAQVVAPADPRTVERLEGLLDYLLR